jgi:hypothetical protein
MAFTTGRKGKTLWQYLLYMCQSGSSIVVEHSASNPENEDFKPAATWQIEFCLRWKVTSSYQTTWLSYIATSCETYEF